MNPYEEKLAQFVEDDVMFNAVKAALFAHFDLNIHVTSGLPRAERFELVDACLLGGKRLEDAFKDLGKYRKSPASGNRTGNPAV